MDKLSVKRFKKKNWERVKCKKWDEWVGMENNLGIGNGQNKNQKLWTMKRNGQMA